MLYENIKRLCEERKISIWALERELGIGNGVIGKWGSKNASPRVETVKTIADYFGVSIDYLLKEGDDNSDPH